MKRLLCLGGSVAQLAVLKKAKMLGHYTVLLDASPDAPGKALADEFHEISTTDIAGVMAFVESQPKVDGVVAYASDPAASTAAMVAYIFDLPGGNPPKGVNILSHKDMFRAFLKEWGFKCPEFGPVLSFPVVVKPTDMSGSKGVTVVRKQDEAEEAIAKAKSFSRSGKVICEEFVDRVGYQIAGDGFVVDGKLVFHCFANEHFDEDGIVPIGESFPSIFPGKVQQDIYDRVQELLDHVGFKNGAINFDIILDKKGDIYLMEIGPRAGGCLIPEVIRYATGFDETEWVIRSALGEDCGAITQKSVEGFWSSYMIHADKDGTFNEIQITDALKDNIVEQEVYVKFGDPVKKYEHSGCVIGAMVLRFISRAEMLHKMDNMGLYLKVLVE